MTYTVSNRAALSAGTVIVAVRPKIAIGCGFGVNLPPLTAWNTRTQTITVLGSADGTNFGTIVGAAGYTFDPATGNTATITYPATTARYLRLFFTANTGWPAGQASEFAVYAT